MQSFLTLAMLFGSTLAAPLNANQNELLSPEKREALPPSVVQIIDFGNGEDSEPSTTDPYVIETATSTTVSVTPTDYPFDDPLGSPDPNGPIGGLDKRQLQTLTGLLGLKTAEMNKRQLDAVTSLLGGLKSEGLNKRQLDAVTGLLGPLLGGLGGAPPAVPPPAPIPGATTTADATTATSAVPTVTNLEDIPTFGSA
ncbi:uncharacterized protein FFB20_10848 [Fusarium fujikuroi]|uniref:Uncharacterized protein n=1 Tax=Fusarium fujikuroi TaxID=5127 RepID=A0A0I9XPA1_FUSFU|nr:uncharacterized protein LW93_14400 [Fusarium fujikuroi]KLP01083.1 uncharacterized protein Y057_1301 [Fusarium fujikuroi]SCN99131.1 uncharacterized protein FFB20_10848 [Fusarium fujikuroi]SCO35710.1 uncharacterized protein FFNC_04726 [Fusarium fujikuroi]VTT55385.1 unnamed protein product [Fusarium fujikuroi]